MCAEDGNGGRGGGGAARAGCEGVGDGLQWEWRGVQRGLGGMGWDGMGWGG